MGGSLGKRGSYFAEQYVVDGGLPGRSRDLWAAWRVTPDAARTPVTLRGGQFTLNLPVDPETFRETTDHYAIWDQTAGDNPFAFFEPKLGARRNGGRRGARPRARPSPRCADTTPGPACRRADSTARSTCSTRARMWW